MAKLDCTALQEVSDAITILLRYGIIDIPLAKNLLERSHLAADFEAIGKYRPKLLHQPDNLPKIKDNINDRST